MIRSYSNLIIFFVLSVEDKRPRILTEPSEKEYIDILVYLSAGRMLMA